MLSNRIPPILPPSRASIYMARVERLSLPALLLLYQRIWSVIYILFLNNKYHIRGANWLTVYSVEPVIIFEKYVIVLTRISAGYTLFSFFFHFIPLPPQHRCCSFSGNNGSSHPSADHRKKTTHCRISLYVIVASNQVHTQGTYHVPLYMYSTRAQVPYKIIRR